MQNLSLKKSLASDLGLLSPTSSRSLESSSLKGSSTTRSRCNLSNLPRSPVNRRSSAEAGILNCPGLLRYVASEGALMHNISNKNDQSSSKRRRELMRKASNERFSTNESSWSSRNLSSQKTAKSLDNNHNSVFDSGVRLPRLVRRKPSYNDDPEAAARNSAPSLVQPIRRRSYHYEKEKQAGGSSSMASATTTTARESISTTSTPRQGNKQAKQYFENKTLDLQPEQQGSTDAQEEADDRTAPTKHMSSSTYLTQQTTALKGFNNSNKGEEFFLTLNGDFLCHKAKIPETDACEGGEDQALPSSSSASNSIPSIEVDEADPCYDLGISTFDFCLYPEGKSMKDYNQSNPKAHKSLYMSTESWKSGSAQAILKDFMLSIHPDDLTSVSTFLQKQLQLCAHWSERQQLLPKGTTPPSDTAASRFRVKVPGKSGYRTHELRTRLTMTQVTHNEMEESTSSLSFLVICDGAFLDISETKAREEELQEKTSALEREVAYHKTTQEALREALLDIKESHEKLQQQQAEITPPKDIIGNSNSNTDLDMEGVLEDLLSLKGLLECSKFPQKRWANNILNSLSSKLEAAAKAAGSSDVPDEISEVTWGHHRNG